MPGKLAFCRTWRMVCQGNQAYNIAFWAPAFDYITHAASIGSAPKKVLYIFEGCFCKLCKMQMNGTAQKLGLQGACQSDPSH